ncbi:MAG: tetratricopeptide repeat protein [Verrucomicrobia bacterium]|nr:tetratricopeptide repeat protein [Verrucomicrobiota bacterium]
MNFCVLALIVCLSGCSKNPTALLLDGEQLLNQGQYAKAVEKLEQAATGLETNANAWNKLGLAHQYLGHFEKARNAYQSALEIDASIPEVYYNLGMLYFDKNQDDAAISNLHKYTIMVPDSTRGYLSLAAAYRRVNRLDDAMVALNSARSIDQNDVTILNEIALTNFQQGDVETARAYLTSIMNSDPGFAPAVLNMAIITHNNDNNKPYALNLYQRYLALNPPAERAQKVREIVSRLENEIANPESNLLPDLEKLLPTEPDNGDQSVAEEDPSDKTPPEETTERPQMGFLDSDEDPGPSHRPDPSDPDTQPTTSVVEVAGTNLDKPTTGTQDPAAEKEKLPASTLPDADVTVDVGELPKPDLEVSPGKEYSRPQIPKAYGLTQTLNEREVFIVPVTPEPIAIEAPAASEAQFEYPYQDIKRLLDANRAVLNAYGLSMPDSPSDEQLKKTYYRSNPVPSGVTPLEPLAPVDSDQLREVRTIGSPDLFQPELNDPEVNLGTLRSISEPRQYAVVDAPEVDETPSETADIPPAPAKPFPTPSIDRSGYPEFEYRTGPPPSEGDRLLARPYFDDGVRAYQANQYGLATNFFIQAATQDASYYEAWFNLGILFLRTNQPSRAFEPLQNAISLRPENIDLHYYLGQALTNEGYIPDAVAAFQKVLELKPEHINSHYALARIYETKLNDVASARFHFARLLEINPSHPQSTSIRYWLRDNP